MTTTLVNKPYISSPATQDRSLSGMIRAMLGTRREILKITALARRERLQRGYRHVPQRVWDRRSALLLAGSPESSGRLQP